ncbi:hypothetical protein [Hellea balneolensis]|uniref:hypothetical protein n=1 Tax=Hellea balneolensis TaxID=287478 RepID=UPI00047C7A62|nr:hypothetical protein [Hellea balneolensis]
MDLLNKYLNGYSPYIQRITYDLDERKLVIACSANSDNRIQFKELIFRDIVSFKEVLFEDAFDDNLTDSIIGIHMISDGVYCVNTEKRELFMQVDKEPIVQVIEKKAI